MMMITKDTLKKYLLIIFGFLIFILYFWSRFLRVRTSKHLPLELNIFQFLIIASICCIFLFIIISLLRNSSQNNIIEKIIDWIYTPIMELHSFITNIPFIKGYYHEYYIRAIPTLEYLIIKTHYFYIIFWIIPRLILLIAFFVDVFVFHQFHYKYMVILIGLLLFFNRLFKYSLKSLVKQVISDLEPYIEDVVTPYEPYIHPDEDPDDPDYDAPTMSLPVNIFIAYSAQYIVYANIRPELCWIRTTSLFEDEVYMKYKNQKYPSYGKITSDDRQLIMKEEEEFLIPVIEKLITFSVLLEYYNITSNQNKQIKNIKILIYINYLLCWLYVLITSIPFVTNISDLLFTDNIEPFSGLIL